MKYVTDNCSVELSVRELCARAFSEGDLGYGGRGRTDAMHVGSEIHRRIQKDSGANYTPEVTLVNTYMHGGIYYTVSGRADGVIRGGGRVTVDEIKSVKPFDFFAPPKDIFVAQMKCYAYFLACREELERIRGRITYVNSDSGKIKYFDYEYHIDDLRLWYKSVIMRISRAASFMKHRVEQVLPTAENAAFPYGELREGQEIMIREGYLAMKRGERLFVQAPTGTGKTISSMFPAVRALGKGDIDKIFYLTAKASTRREAYLAAAKIFKTGVKLRTVILNSKESMCRCQSRQDSSRNLCDPAYCPYASGYYDRVNDALRELLGEMNGYPAKAILSVAEKYGICPYELSLDLSEFCDIIICDYNYAFDPSVYLRRYFADGGKREKYAFLIDEAHNLADRARDMYSARLSRAGILRAADGLSENDSEMVSAIESVIAAFSPLRELCRDSIVKDSEGNERGFYMSRSPLPDLCRALESFRQRCDRWLRKNELHPSYDAVFSLLSAVKKYICVSEYFDKGFLCYVELGGGDIAVKTYCLDPSALMNSLLSRAKSAVMFSATLTPAEYFCDVLGSSKNSTSVCLPSPFSSDSLCVAVAVFVSTRYEDRAANVRQYVSAIAATVSAAAGNYIVYFPSYDCLDKVSKAFCQKYPQVEVVVQKRGMGGAEKEAFLSCFKEDRGKLRVGFCVLGGAFSEGVDLPGSRLIGVIIIGVGLPGLSNERNIIKDYFDVDSGRGYDYAYTYPGMNNVLQAAGRVIRTDSDKGIVVLVDDRYASPQYRALFPQHWKNVKYAGNFSSLAEIARRFWKNRR